MNKLIMCFVLMLSALSSVYAQRKFGKVQKEEIEQKAHDKEPDASAAVLYRNHFTTFNYINGKGFYMETYVHEIVKIYNSKGYSRANIEVPLYRSKKEYESIKSIKGITYNMINGEVVKDKLTKQSIFEEEASEFKKIKKITMPNIQDGSVMEIKYTFVSPFTFNVNEFVFQEDIPVDQLQMTFFAPEYFNYKTHSKGWVPYTSAKDTRARKLTLTYYVNADGNANRTQEDKRVEDVEFRDIGTIIDLKDVPSIKEEPFCPNISNYKAGLQFELVSTKFPNSFQESYSTNWSDVAHKIYESNSFGNELDKKSYFKKDIDALLIGTTSTEETVAKIYSYVKNYMNWDGYSGIYARNGVSKAYKEKVGNVAEINLMLTAMLQYAKVPANPVLISSKSNGIPLFPNLNAYNYVVSGVEAQGGVLLLDAADASSGLNLLDESLLNWTGRLVREDGSSKNVSLYPVKPAAHRAMINLEFDEDFYLQGTVKNQYSGHFARTMRSEMYELGEEELSQMVEKTVGDALVESVELKDLKKTSKPLIVSYDLEELGMVEKIGDNLYFSPTTVVALKENYFKSETRKFPIDFAYARHENFIANIKIPEGYIVESLPEKLAINLPNNAAQYRFDINQMGNSVTVTLSRKINKPIFSSKNYPHLKSFFKMIVDKESEKIVLKKI